VKKGSLYTWTEVMYWAESRAGAWDDRGEPLRRGALEGETLHRFYGPECLEASFVCWRAADEKPDTVWMCVYCRDGS
jgi:hypothetical protein